MVQRTRPVRNIILWAGGGGVALLLFLSFGNIVALWIQSDFTSGLNRTDLRVIQFTIFQALLSATLSILFAVPTARALARRVFPGRQIFITILGAPFILPVIVAIFGILAIWGRSGLFSGFLETLGQEPLNIYGLTGILLAHVFFNLPLATRLILQGWMAVPAEHFRLATQLDLKPSEIFRYIERPILRSVLPTAFLTVFLLCMTTFAVALALGGGPKATTLELAIYQALRFEFNLPKAAVFALIQCALCTFAGALAFAFMRPEKFASGLGHVPHRWDAKGRMQKIMDGAVLASVGLFLFLPIGAVFLKGLVHLSKLPSSAFSAALNSVLVACASATLCLSLALILSILIVRLTTQRKMIAYFVEGAGFLSLAVSPFVVGTGLFIMMFPILDPFRFALPLTAFINAVMALPFALRIVLPSLLRAETHYGRLAHSLGMPCWARFRRVIWPRIRPAVGFALGLSAALSMGDLGVITLFAPPDITTLPLTMYRLMASYQTEAAAAVALVLVSVSLSLFWLFEYGGRRGFRM